MALNTILSYTVMSLICFRQGHFSRDGVHFLKEEGMLCAAGKRMSDPAG